MKKPITKHVKVASLVAAATAGIGTPAFLAGRETAPAAPRMALECSRTTWFDGTNVDGVSLGESTPGSTQQGNVNVFAHRDGHAGRVRLTFQTKSFDGLAGRGIITRDGHALVRPEPNGQGRASGSFSVQWIRPAGHGQVSVYQERSTNLKQDVRKGQVYIGSCGF